jgi:hypothetical protein
LFEDVAVPLAEPATAGAFYRDMRLVSIDGTCLDVADTIANERAFGRPGSGRGAGVGAFPQLRLAGLAECGTHALFDVAIGPLWDDERALAGRLLGSLGPGMLCLADRGLYSHQLWSRAAATGAELLWRTRSSHRLPVIERLPDGSVLSEIYASEHRRRREHGMPVRVIEYAIDDPGRPASDTRYRLLTTILDPDRAPAAELAPLYAQRWEFESTLDELKVHQRGPRVVLRSKTPGRRHPGGLRPPLRALRHPLADAHHRARHRPRSRPHLLHAHPTRRPPDRRIARGLFPPKHSAAPLSRRPTNCSLSCCRPAAYAPTHASSSAR